MAQFQWRFDAPTGVYKNHALSRKLFEAATEKSVMMDFVQPVEGFGKKMGEDVTLTRIANITEPTSAVLTEGERIPEDEFSFTTTSITIQELGRSVPFTSFSTDLSFFDLNNPVQRKLVSQWRLVLDTKIATVFKTAKIKYAITGLAANDIATNGTFGSTSTANMNVFHVEEIRDYMFDTIHVPPIENDDYVGVFRTLGLRGIKRDPAWEEWKKYIDPQAKFNSEVGRLENIRFVESNHANAFGKVGSGSILGEGVVFGEDSVAMAEALTPELRAQINVGDDFGRNNAIAWYAMLNFGLIWTTGNAGEAKVLHVGSL